MTGTHGDQEHKSPKSSKSSVNEINRKPFFIAYTPTARSFSHGKHEHLDKRSSALQKTIARISPPLKLRQTIGLFTQLVHIDRAHLVGVPWRWCLEDIEGVRHTVRSVLEAFQHLPRRLPGLLHVVRSGFPRRNEAVVVEKRYIVVRTHERSG